MRRESSFSSDCDRPAPTGERHVETGGDPGCGVMLVRDTARADVGDAEVGLEPDVAFRALGHTLEPSARCRSRPAAGPAATAAPDPDDEPHGVRSSTYLETENLKNGLFVWAPKPDQPDCGGGRRTVAHADRLGPYQDDRAGAPADWRTSARPLGLARAARGNGRGRQVLRSCCP